MSDVTLDKSQAGIIGDDAHVEGGIHQHMHVHSPLVREVGIPFMVDDLPGDFVERPVELNALRDAILADDHDTPSPIFLEVTYRTANATSAAWKRSESSNKSQRAVTPGNTSPERSRHLG